MQNETDIRTLGSLNRAHPSVVRRMHVTDFESRALTRKPAWTHRREPAEMFEFGEDILLRHELAELVRVEKFLDARLYRARINKLNRIRNAGINRRHPVLNITL